MCRRAGSTALLGMLCLLSACVSHGWTPGPQQSTFDYAPDSRVGVYAQPVGASAANTSSTHRRALGIGLTTVPPELTGWLHMGSPNGLLVLGVQPGGAAAAAGIRADDVLLVLADAHVATIEDIKAALATVHRQDIVAAEIWRNGQMQSVRLTF
jgi:S1-C subfamily serine protease